VKIGILTYFWDENHGTILQAHFLWKALSDFFPNAHVELINYRHARNIQIVKNYFKYKDVFYDFKKKVVTDKFKKNNLELSRKSLISKDYKKAIQFIDTGQYDVVVVGSDTVWQLTSNKRLPRFPNAYWLPGAIKSKKIAFAVSSNITRYEDISEEHRIIMRKALNDFSFIGVRDTMTLDLANSLGIEEGSKLFRVFDPTFLVDPPDTNIKELLVNKGVKFDKPILGINYPPAAPFCSRIVEMYKSLGYQIVTFISRLNSADHKLVCLTPFEWASAYQYFDFVITDRFHGTIFSLKNQVPVLAIDWHPFRYDKSGNSKTRCLMRDFGIEKTNHINAKLMEGGFDFFIDKAEEARRSFNKEKIKTKVNEIRQDCFGYLGKIRSLILDEMS